MTWGPIRIGAAIATGGASEIPAGVKTVVDQGKKIVHTLAGQNDFRAGTYTLPFAPDAGNPAQAAYQAKVAEQAKQNAAFQAEIAAGRFPNPAQYPLAGQPAPAPPTQEELQAGQVQQDRSRIIGTDQNYGKLVGDLQLASTGAGPSAAQDTLRGATDRNNQTAYGMAASGNVAPGQRAALLGAAGAGATLNNQAGARDAAILKANEVSTARGQLGATLGGQTDAEGRLYGGTQDANKTNIDALGARDATNAGITSKNGENAAKITGDFVTAAGSTASAGVKSDIRAKEDIKPLDKPKSGGGLFSSLGLRKGQIFGPGMNSPDPPPYHAPAGSLTASNSALARSRVPEVPLAYSGAHDAFTVNGPNPVGDAAAEKRGLEMADALDRSIARKRGATGAPAAAPQNVFLAEDPNDTEYTMAEPGQDYGFSMSDERSKEKIASLEKQLGLAEQYGAVDQPEKDAYDMQDANVHYPDQGMTDRDTYAAVDKQAAMRRASSLGRLSPGEADVVERLQAEQGLSAARGQRGQEEAWANDYLARKQAEQGPNERRRFEQIKRMGALSPEEAHMFESAGLGARPTPEETFANVDRSAELRRRARVEQPVFYDEQADTMRDPVQQMRHTRELAGTGQGYPELASREGSRVALAPVHPYEYQYKPKFAQDTGADGEPRAGIMAQELAASPNPALRSAVIKDPKDGMLAIDHNRAISSSLALNAGLDKRLRDIEDALGKPTEYPTLPGGPPPRSLGLAGRQASR